MRKNLLSLTQTVRIERYNTFAAAKTLYSKNERKKDNEKKHLMQK